MKRLWLTGSIVMLALCASGVLAQEVSDSDRLKQGIDLYGNRKYEEAIQVLKEIDTSQLPKFDQKKPALYIEQAEQGLAKQKQAGAKVALGEQALLAKKYVTAINQFGQAQKDDHLSEAAATRLDSLIRVAKKGEEAERAVILDTLTDAKLADSKSDTPGAIKGYQKVVAADVYLPDADRQYAMTRLALLTGEKKPTVPVEVPSDETPKVADADNGMPPVVTPSDETPVTTPKDETPVVVPSDETPVVVPSDEKPTVPTVVDTTPPAVDADAVRRQAIAARAAELIEKAEAAVATNDLQAAKMHYTKALSVDPTNAVAKAGLERIDTMLGRGDRSLLAKEADRLSVEQQRVIAKVRESMKKARSVREIAERPDDYDNALDELRLASRLISQSRVLTPELAEDLREEVRELWDSVEQDKTTVLEVIDRERRESIRDSKVARKQADEAARKRQIESLWTSSQQLVGRHKYNEAIAVLDQLLVIEPQHEKARRFREDYAFLAGLRDQINIRQNRKTETRIALADAEDASIPWNEIYRYPSPREWQELTAKRKRFVMGASGESEVVTATRRKLSTKGIVNGEDWSITLNLTATGLGSVLDFIAEAARSRPREINIIIDRQGIDAAGVALDDPIDLTVKDVSIEQALRMVLGDQLGYIIQDDGSVLVSSRDRLNQDLPVTSYFVGDLITQVPDFGQWVPRMSIADVLRQGGDSGGGGGGVDLFGDTTEESAEESGTQRLRELIERTVRSTEPWESMGGRATLDFYERSGLMLVSQTPDGHQKLQGLLDSLRRERAIMISIESRFITVSDAFLNDVTLDFDVAFHHMSDKWGAPPPTDAHLGPAGAVGGVPYDTLPDTGGVPPAVGQPIIIGNTTSNGQGTASLMPGLGIFGNMFAPATWGANQGGMIISGVILDDIQLGFLIRAIQADRRSTQLFAPRLTLWNGQRSWISDGTHFAYVSDLEPVVAEAAVGWDPEISYLVSGSVLDVKATASADRRYVQLDLRPQVAQPPTFGAPIPVQAAVPGMVATATITLPSIHVTHLMTSVSVPDGGTLLIGGVKMYEEHDVESGVPVLSKVPILKRLFSNRAQVRGQQNLIILVKPTIIIQAEKEEELGVDEFYD